MGVVYSLWPRSRGVLLAVALYIVILAVAIQIVHAQMQVSILGTLSLSAVVAHLLTVITLGPANLDARGSGFPQHAFVLPETTRALVIWPMLMGCAFMASLWMIIAIVILRADGLNVPVFWPAA